MAISNSYDFTLTRDEIIEAALRKLNALLEGNTANTAKITNGAQALNVMLKSWSSKSYPIHNIRRAFVLPNLPSTQSRSQNRIWDINIGRAGTNHVTSLYTHTTTTATTAALGTTITVSSISGILNGTRIGVELTSTSSLIHWTTVNGVPSGSTVTLATAIPAGQSVPVGAHVYNYDENAYRVPRPTAIHGQWIINFEQNTRYPINLRPEDEILNTASSTNPSGAPVNISYRSNYYGEPLSTDGVLFLYPGWGDAANIIELRAQYPFSDMDNPTDEVQAPPEWFQAIIYGLADRLAPEYGLDVKLRMILKKEAQDFFDEAMLGSNENSSMFIQPDKQGM
jgi:hypothetical protein